MPLFHPQTVGFFKHFMRAYPLRSVIMVGLLALAGFLEGVGVITLLPLLELVVGESGREPSGISRAMGETLESVGLTPSLGVLLGVIVAAMTAKSLVLWVAMRQVGFTVAQVTTDLRMELLRALMGARWRYYTSRSTGHFANAISTEAHRAASAYKEGCALMAGLFQVAMYLVVAFLVSWKVALFALVAGSILLFSLRRLVQMAREAGQQQTDLMASLIGRLTDALRGIKPIRTMGREQHLQPLLEEETEGLNEALRRQVTAAETLKLFHEPAVSLVLAVGIFLALGTANFPFATIMVLAFIFYRLMAHARTIQGEYQVLSAGESAFWALRKQIDEAREEREPLKGRLPPPPLEEGIRLEGVSFSYDDTPVLRSIQMAVPSGAFAALYGPSGVGKTTVADLIIGLHEPDRGRVTVDGIPLEDLDLIAWRRSIGYVPQEVLLFHDTIHRNVTLGDESLSEADVRAALKAADAWDFVAARPEGSQAVVGEGGAKLSGGQRQRIALARALVHRPRLLILDEATAALDPETEAEILDTLRRLPGEVTILAISHQPALRDAADLVFHLEDGRIAQVERAGEETLVRATARG